jgi:hypothetical protein
MRILCHAKGLLLTIISSSAEWLFVTVCALRKGSFCFFFVPCWGNFCYCLCTAKGLFFFSCRAEGTFVTVSALRNGSFFLLILAPGKKFFVANFVPHRTALVLVSIPPVWFALPYTNGSYRPICLQAPTFFSLLIPLIGHLHSFYFPFSVYIKSFFLSFPPSPAHYSQNVCQRYIDDIVSPSRGWHGLHSPAPQAIGALREIGDLRQHPLALVTRLVAIILRRSLYAL